MLLFTGLHIFFACAGLVTLSFADAFGENERPASGEEDVVPPNASLQINLELVSWKTVTDITKSKKVLKKTLKEGEKYERPNDGSLVQGRVLINTFQSHVSPLLFSLLF